jgi:hypothetical protein
MNDATLDEQLREGVCEMLEAYPSRADWDGVMRAAAGATHERAPRRRRVPRVGRALLIATALVLVGGSIAFALADRLVAAFSTPPPVSIEQQMRQYSEFGGPTPAGPIVPASGHLLITLATRRFGVVRLYSARTTHGVCELIVREGRRSGQCSPDRAATGSPVVFGVGGTPEKPGSNLIDGHTVSPAAHSLRIRFQRGTSRSVPVRRRFFLFELGPGHSQRSSDPPVAFDVLDASGRVLGTRRNPFAPLPAARPAPASVRVVARATLALGGARVALRAGDDARGHACFQALVNGRTTIFPRWMCVRANAQRLPAVWIFGASSNGGALARTFAFGRVAAHVVRLQLRFEDGTSTDVELHHGYFLYAIPAASWKLGHRPSAIRTFVASGSATSRRLDDPRQRCVYRDPGQPCGSGTVIASGVTLAP